MTNQKEVATKASSTINLDKAIIIRSSDGTEIRRIKTQMKLSVLDGTLVKLMDAKRGYSFKDKQTGDLVVIPDRPATLIPTATAYMKMAAGCGVSLDHPDTVIVGGTAQPNGYCSPEGTYYFRSRAGGFTANGQPFITDRTVDFNVHRYNIQDLLAKAKKDKYIQYFKVKPYKGVDKAGALIGSPADSWAGYKIDESVVLWVNCECPDFIDWLSEMNNRIKNAIRVAQTFADRNAIAAHPALPVQKKFDKIEAVVDLTSWYAKTGANTFKLLENDKSSVTIDVSAESIVAENEETRQTVNAEAAAAPVDQTDYVPEEQEEDLPSESGESRAPKTGEAQETKPNSPAPILFNREEVIKDIDSILDKTKATKIKKVMDAVGIKWDDGEAWNQATDEKLKALLSLLKC